MLGTLGQWEVTVSPHVHVLPRHKRCQVAGYGVLLETLGQWEVSVSPDVLSSRDISLVD